MFLGSSVTTSQIALPILIIEMEHEKFNILQPHLLDLIHNLEKTNLISNSNSDTKIIYSSWKFVAASGALSCYVSTSRHIQ